MKKIINLIILTIPLSVNADYIAKIPLHLPIKFSNATNGNEVLNPIYPEGEEKGNSNFNYKFTKSTFYSYINPEDGNYTAEPIEILVNNNNKDCYSVEIENILNENDIIFITENCTTAYPTLSDLGIRILNLSGDQIPPGQTYNFPAIITSYNGSFSNKIDPEVFNDVISIRKEQMGTFTNITFNQSFTIGQANYNGLDFYGVGVSSIVNEQYDFYSFGASSPYSFINGGVRFYFEEFSIADNGDGSCTTTLGFRTDIQNAYYYADQWLSAINDRNINPWGFIVEVNGEQLVARNYSVYRTPDYYPKILVDLVDINDNINDINDGPSGVCNNNVLSALRDNVDQNINITISSFVQ